MSEKMALGAWAQRDEAAREMERRLGLRAERDEPLASHTTMRVGGPADLLVTVKDRFALRGIVRLATSRGWPLLVLGRGSNVVVSDRGVRGIVVLNRSAASEVDAASGEMRLDSGVPMARAATLAADAGLTGMEFALAIPGNIGGAVWANAGAHGAEIADVLRSATILRPDGSEEEVAAASLAFSYRDSQLKHAAGAGSVVLGASFALRHDEPALIKERLEEIRTWRREHQPLGVPSAGSVFRNPPGSLSAGALIEAVGLKGRNIGGAEISLLHANWILNRGGATANDVRALHDLCISEVQRSAGVHLESEIVFIGDDAPTSRS
ncbi:MAG: UDP-N-acetylmuramate dehydrogenase [Chloroflexi bacterium]|nr:MAG: UDP-N-acetylmuramate dehydrogenase [Chloroflexota bacterium]